MYLFLRKNKPMSKAGRKKGSTDPCATAQREALYRAYDELRHREFETDILKARFLPRAYYIEKLYEMRIAQWTKRYILYLLINRPRYERK